jgi:hypothetical protein
LRVQESPQATLTRFWPGAGARNSIATALTT